MPPPHAIALLLPALFLALTPGTIDGEMVYWETVALSEHGHPAVRPIPSPHFPALVERGFLQIGEDGSWFVRYSLGQLLAALPWGDPRRSGFLRYPALR